MSQITRQFEVPLAFTATRPTEPVMNRVVTWFLLLLLLNMVAKGSLSFLSPPATAFDYQNGYLLRTEQAIRVPVVLNLLLLVGFAIAGNRKTWRVLASNQLMLLGIVFAAVSSLWSESPVITLRVSVELGLSTLLACFLTAQMSTERLMSLLMFVGTVAGALSIVMAVLFPSYGICQGYGAGAWQGICSHKNTLGLGMAFLLTPVFFVQRRLAFKMAYSALLIFLIAMSKSRGAWFETAGLILFAGGLSLFRKFKTKDSLFVVCASSILVVGIVAGATSQLAPLTRMIGKDPTLTGRTGIYAAVLDSIAKHPVLGYGFGAFWGGLNQESYSIAARIHWSSIGYAENGFLELWLQLGAVGVGIVLLMFGNAIRQGARLIRSPYYNPRIGWFCAVIVLELLTNIESGWLMVGNTIDWTLTLVAFIGLANEMRRVASFPPPEPFPTGRQNLTLFAQRPL